MMKTLFTILAILFALPALAANVTVAWDPNPPAEQVDGYTIHWGAASGVYDQAQDVTAGTEGVVTLPDTTPSYLAVTAWRMVNGTRLESDYSNEVVYDPEDYAIPGAPVSARAVQVEVTRPDGTTITVVIP